MELVFAETSIFGQKNFITTSLGPELVERGAEFNICSFREGQDNRFLPHYIGCLRKYDDLLEGIWIVKIGRNEDVLILTKLIIADLSAELCYEDRKANLPRF